MIESKVNPISWNEAIGRYVEAPENYTGPSTKISGRVAQDSAVQHFIARQLQLIAESLSSQKVVNDELRKQISNRSSKVMYDLH
jgi:hypothetical protein